MLLSLTFGFLGQIENNCSVFLFTHLLENELEMTDANSEEDVTNSIRKRKKN